MTQLTQRVAARHRLRRSQNKKDPLRRKHGYNDRLRSELDTVEYDFEYALIKGICSINRTRVGS